MRSFIQSLKFGKEKERQIAEAAVSFRWPGAVLQRLPEKSAIDFLVIHGHYPVAALEVKRRSLKLSDFCDTILPDGIVRAATALNDLLAIPPFAAILFADNLLAIFPILPAGKRMYIKDRSGKPALHYLYNLQDVAEVFEIERSI